MGFKDKLRGEFIKFVADHGREEGKSMLRLFDVKFFNALDDCELLTFSLLLTSRDARLTGEKRKTDQYAHLRNDYPRAGAPWTDAEDAKLIGKIFSESCAARWASAAQIEAAAVVDAAPVNAEPHPQDKGTVNEAMRAKPENRKWEGSYTKTVADRLGCIPAFKPLTTADTVAIQDARDLLKDYHDTQHVVYEQRDKLRVMCAPWANGNAELIKQRDEARKELAAARLQRDDAITQLGVAREQVTRLAERVVSFQTRINNARDALDSKP